MTRSGLIKKIASSAGLTSAQSEAALDALTDAIKGELLAGNRIILTGIGTFETVHREAREAFNPLAKKVIKIDEGRRVKFSPSGTLKRCLNPE